MAKVAVTRTISTVNGANASEIKTTNDEEQPTTSEELKNETGKATMPPRKGRTCRRICLPIYSILVTAAVVVLFSLLMVEKREVDKSGNRLDQLAESLERLQHNDSALMELSNALTPPLNFSTCNNTDNDENNRNLLAPAVCEGDWHQPHAVWFNGRTRRRVSKTGNSVNHAKWNVKLECLHSWNTCFYGPIVEAARNMERHLANNPNHGGHWRCENAYHIAHWATNNNMVGPWCERHLRFGPFYWYWAATCHADCYAHDCHYVHKCDRLSC